MALDFSSLLDLGIRGIAYFDNKQKQRDLSSQLSNLATTASTMSSPYSLQDRQLAANKLRAFTTGQAGPEQLPGYQQLVKQQERMFARAGKSFSGGAPIELAQALQGEQLKYMQFLANVAGAGFNPSAGGNLYSQVLGAKMASDYNSNAGLFDLLTHAADVFSTGKKAANVLGFLNGEGGGTISDVLSGVFGGGASLGIGGSSLGGASTVLSGAGIGDLGSAAGGGLSSLFGGAGGLGASLAAMAPFAIPAAILTIPKLLNSKGGDYNPVTGKAATFGDALPTVSNGKLTSTPASSISGYSYGGLFSPTNQFQSGEAGFGAFGQPITLQNPVFGPNVTGDTTTWITPNILHSLLPPSPDIGSAAAGGM